MTYVVVSAVVTVVIADYRAIFTLPRALTTVAMLSIETVVLVPIAVDSLPVVVVATRPNVCRDPYSAGRVGTRVIGDLSTGKSTDLPGLIA